MTQITFKNNPIKLSGSEVNEGDIAPISQCLIIV